MKPCPLRSWSRNYLLRLVATLAIAGGVIAWLKGQALTTFAGVALTVVVDWLAFVLQRPLRRSNFSLKVRLVGDHETDSVLCGREFEVHAELRALRPLPGLHAAMLVPGQVRSIGTDGFAGRLIPDVVTALRFRFRAEAPGVAVFPGLLLQMTSPLGMSYRRLFLPARRQMALIPNFEQSADAALQRFLRTSLHGGQLKTKTLRGMGSDFRELREYRQGDPINRIDWKATARRAELSVREFETPPEFTVRIFLEASPELVHGTGLATGYGNAATVIGKFGAVVAASRLRCVLSIYHESATSEVVHAGDWRGLSRLMSELILVPEQVMVATAMKHKAGGRVYRDFSKAYRHSIRSWSGHDGASDAEEFLDRYLPGEPNTARRQCLFLSDFAPHRLFGLSETCVRCGAETYADEPRCPHCGFDTGSREGLTARAQALADVLVRALKTAKGREMWIIISTLRGGEASPQLMDILALAAAGHRSVHMILPDFQELVDARPNFPGSLGAARDRARLLEDVHRLLMGERFVAFRDRLRTAGVHLHRADDSIGLDQLVSKLMLQEAVHT